MLRGAFCWHILGLRGSANLYKILLGDHLYHVMKHEALKKLPATLYPLIYDHLYQVHSLRDLQRTSSSVSAQTGDTLGLHHFLIHFYSSNVDRMFLVSPFTSPLTLCCNCAAMHNDTPLLTQQAFLTNDRNDGRD